jgi:hypothetical protein
MNRISFFVLFLSVWCFSSCCKEEAATTTPTKPGPTSVTFMYNGKQVTYGVVKREYQANLDGVAVGLPKVRYWMDRNLGAERVATSMLDSLSFGHYFQWGRGADGHQLPNSPLEGNIAGDAQPGHNRFIDGYLSNIIPTYSSWVQVSYDYYADLWNYRCTQLNNPCPRGWHVATNEDYKLESKTWPSQFAPDAFNSSLKLPSAGFRLGRDGYGVPRPFYKEEFVVNTLEGFFFLKKGQNIYSPSNYNEATAGRCLRCVMDSE